jgi:hypothetical protein
VTSRRHFNAGVGGQLIRERNKANRKITSACYNARFEVSTKKMMMMMMVVVKIQVFCDITQCRSANSYRRFGGTAMPRFRSITPNCRVRSQASLCELCTVQNGTEAGFSPRVIRLSPSVPLHKFPMPFISFVSNVI